MAETNVLVCLVCECLWLVHAWGSAASAALQCPLGAPAMQNAVLQVNIENPLSQQQVSVMQHFVGYLRARTRDTCPHGLVAW